MLWYPMEFRCRWMTDWYFGASGLRLSFVLILGTLVVFLILVSGGMNSFWVSKFVCFCAVVCVVWCCASLAAS